MKRKSSVVPNGNENFNNYLILVYFYIKDNLVRLGIITEDFETLTAYLNDPEKGWIFFHKQHSNPATKTAPLIADMKVCKKAITQLLQKIYRNISRSVMTNTDYQTFNIAVPDTHKTPRAAITNRPFVNIIALGGAILKFIVRTATDAKRASMDPLADEIRVMGIILKPGDALPTDPSQCTITFTSTRAIFKHNFSMADSGNRFACYVQYVNTSDESKNGPVSAMLVCVIGM